MALYLEVVEINAPAVGFPHQNINMTITVRNKSSSSMAEWVTGTLDYATGERDITFLNVGLYLYAEQMHTMPAQFVMPPCDVTMHIRTSYYANGAWYPDEEKISMVRVCPVVVSKVEFEYDSTRVSLPAINTINIPQSASARIHAFARNISNTAQQAGFYWLVHASDGTVAEEYNASRICSYINPGAEREFTGNTFILAKSERWSLMPWSLRLDLIGVSGGNTGSAIVYWSTLCMVGSGQFITPTITQFVIADFVKCI